MSTVKEIFEKQVINTELLGEVEKIAEPTINYLIAMTPRSGSSYLCDVMSKTNELGWPDEYLELEFLPDNLRRVPARDADEYLLNVSKVLQSANRVSGLKASWFQFHLFYKELNNVGALEKFKYIYLTRRDLSAQAVSLYKATESSVFHTNINHSKATLAKLSAIEYDYSKIKYWYVHIVAQEIGWKKFFAKFSISPLVVTYEDIEEDIAAVVEKIASYLGVKLLLDVEREKLSIFKKLGDHGNIEWANRFSLELNLPRSRDSKIILLLNRLVGKNSLRHSK